MPGDIERVTFDPRQMFANVLLQQGRLLLPADFNEQSAIHHYFLRNLIADLVGRRWRADKGFTVRVDAASDLKVSIAAGHFYVDGIMCDNAAECAFDAQPFGPVPDNPEAFDEDAAAIYLDCWEREVTCLNYPRLRDPALGGADTATRLQIAWQARLLSKKSAAKTIEPMIAALEARGGSDDAIKALRDALRDLENGVTCESATAMIDAMDKALPLMAADAKNEEENPEACAIAGDSEYRGRENQLYRVQIHRGGLADHATFKWSRENGSVAFRVLDVDVDAGNKVTRVTLESLGRDRRTGICNDQWVELVDDATEFEWRAEPLMRVTGIDPHRRLVTLAGVSGVSPRRHAILRRWDQSGDGLAAAVPVLESKDDTGWVELERGVRIRFVPGGLYRTGDYWLMRASVATGDIEWPEQGGKPLAVEPHGIRRHRAILGTVQKTATTGKWKLDKTCSCSPKPLC